MAKTLDSATIEELAAALDDKLEVERPGMYQHEIKLPDEGVARFDRLIKRRSRR